MKALRILLIIVVAIAAIFFIGGLFLPKTYSVSRSKIIKAPESVVFSNVANFNNFLKWNPWTKMEPSAKVEITGTPAKPGHLWKWKGEETGQGQMEITNVYPNSKVDFLLTFTAPFQSIAKNSFNFEPEGNPDEIKVTWSMNGNSNSIMERWMYLNMDNMIGKDFESGLENLKQLSENSK
jgi:hypothetical protein